MSEIVRGGIVPGNPGDRIWAEPDTGGEAYIPLRFDSLGSPLYRHQLPPSGIYCDCGLNANDHDAGKHAWFTDDDNVIRGED